MAEYKRINDACDKSDDLNAFRVFELKKYLSEHGQNVSGNKNELIARIKGVRLLGLKDVNSVAKESEKLDQQRKTDKLSTQLGERLPHPDTLRNWSTDFQRVPDFTEKEIYNYLVLKMNSKKQLKSKVFYEDRHVHDVEINELDNHFSQYYIKSKVIPSLPTEKKTHTPDYKVWVMLSKVTGSINSAECNCTAGEGEACNHIAALMYAVADISKRKKDGTLAPTSEKCKWNNPRKRKLSPQKAQDIKFRKQIWGRETLNRNLTQAMTTKMNIKTDVNRFKRKLVSANSKAGWLRNFSPENTTNGKKGPELPLLHNILYQYADSETICDDLRIKTFEQYFKSLAVSHAETSIIECLTREQSDSLIWKKAREERLTASNFGHVVKRKMDTPPDSLLKSLMGYRTFDSKYMEWGRNHEAAARRTYIGVMKKTHPGVKVKQCGLLVNHEYPHLGASPDGLVHCGHCPNPNGVLEIKCPASGKWRMLTPDDCSKDPNFFCYLDKNGQVTLKRNHKYFYQVQGQMAISKTGWCDFVVWTCTGNVSVERISFDPDFWMNTLKKLNDFYLKSFIPELFSRRVMRGKKLHENCDCFPQSP